MKETRYPGYDVMKGLDSPDWDEQTREVVLERLAPYTFKFLTAAEADLVEMIGLRITPQPGRDPRERIRVAPSLDKKLFIDRRDGFRFESLPPQREAFRIALRLIDELGFRQMNEAQQDDTLRKIESGEVNWKELSSADFFKHMLLPYLVGAYYEHPTAWNETGYTGPAAKRGHVRIWEGGVDDWEVKASR